MSEFENDNYDGDHSRYDEDQMRSNDIQHKEQTDAPEDYSQQAVSQQPGLENEEGGRYRYKGDPYKASESDENSYVSVEDTKAGDRMENHFYDNDMYRDTQEDAVYEDSDDIAAGGSHKNKKRKKGSGLPFGKIIAAALVFGLVSGGVIVGISVAKNKLYPSSADRIETTKAASEDSSESTEGTGSTSTDTSVQSQDVSNVVNEVMPAVVSITSTIQSSGYYGFGTQQSEGAGSGFIIAKTKDNLMIATNNHVVADATALTVGFVDSKTADATVVGTDSDADLAVISVKLSDIADDTASKIKVAVIGSSDDLKVGEAVVAIGNALGYGQSVTTGVVSAKNREVSFTDGTMTLLQTDAAINPGNSGGVLINLKGEVVGINNAKLEDTSVEGMGYAIPISTAQTVLDDLMNAGSISESEAAFLGIVGKTIDSTYSNALGMPSGIYVTQVISGSPAEKAGISAGDVITAFEGNNVSTMDGLKEKLSIKKANTKVKITFKRANQNGEYKEQTVKVTLGKKSDYADTDTTESTQDSTQSTQNSNGNSGNNNGSQGVDPYEYFFGNGDSGNSSNPYYYYYNN